MTTASFHLMSRPAPREASASLDAICEEISRTAALPLRLARTLPREAYTDEAFFEQEAQKVLASGWMCIAHVSQLRETGAYLAIELLGEPIVVVRGEDQIVRAFSRVCPHRAADILHECFKAPREGVTKRFRCPYHAWTFALDGALVAAPEMDAAEGFVETEWPLTPFRTEIWHGFVFVNLDASAPPLAEQYAEFGALIEPWNVAEMEVAIELNWECDFNWKVMIENWMESYHHIGAHLDTLQPTMPARSTWTEAERPHFIRAHLPFRDANAEEIAKSAAGGGKLPGFLPVATLTLEQQTEWGLYLGHPCFMFLTMRDRVLWYRLQPVSAQRCRLTTMTLISREARKDPSFDECIAGETEFLRYFHVQDMEVNVAVQSGLKSSTAVRGRLSHLEEPVWLIQRHLAARLQGRYPERASAPGHPR